MTRPPPTLLSLVAMLVVGSGCAAPLAGSASPGASAAAAASDASVIERRQLPAGFPVLPGAVAMPLPADDAGLVGLWQSDQVGSVAYDYYVTALPAAGFPIVGRYPGGAVALIRFSLPAGDIWQLVVHATASADATAIEVRLDRP